MDPYIEQYWLDLHPRLISHSSDQMQGQLGDDLVARIEERLIVESSEGYARQIVPDVSVIEIDTAFPQRATGSTALAEPMVIRIAPEPHPQRSIDIIDTRTGGRVITTIEFVSPSNKLSGDGRKKYEQKQQECMDARVNLVEIDLTQTGERNLICHRSGQLAANEFPYIVSCWRAVKPEQAEFYPLSLRTRLPTIRIPLRRNEADITLDLQTVVETCYAAARYDLTTRYRNPPTPPLIPSDATWAADLLGEVAR